MKTDNHNSLSYLILLVFLLAGLRLMAQTPSFPAFTDHCISDDERKLYNLIAAYRSEHQLPAVELSLSLSYVARIHVMDLTMHRPDFGGCNLHSWSDKGNWKPCCYAKDENRIACMTQKPKELTGYKFKAYEVVYSSGEPANAEDAFGFWKEIALMNDYLLNTGKWTKHWQAIGVGINGEYACVWFGEGADMAGAAINCSDTAAKNQAVIADAALLYYIITGNVSTKEQAEAEVKKLTGKGFKNALYIQGTTFYRIAANRFSTETDAYKELQSIKKQYPDAWVLKPKK